MNQLAINRNCSTSEHRVCWFAVLFAGLVALVVCTGFDFASIQQVKLSDFKSRGCNEDGKLSWELWGASAEVRGPKAQLEKVRLTFYLKDGERVLLTSPRCSFNQATQIGKSDEAIHVESQVMTLDGVGYDVLAETHKVRIRSNVRMIIKRKAGALKNADPFAGLGKREPVPPKKGKDAGKTKVK